MSNIPTWLELIEKDVKIIVPDLKKNYPNQTVSKVSIRLKYKLPHTRSTDIFFKLGEFGFVINRFSITIPNEHALPLIED